MPTKATCPGSMTLTKDGSACEFDLDIPLYCGLNSTKKYEMWPQCNATDKTLIHKFRKVVAASSTSSSSSSSGIAKAKLKPSCSDILNVQYGDLLDSITEIHAFEGKLFQDLEVAEQTKGGTATMDVAQIKAKIKDLSNLRKQLYHDLNNILTSSQCNLADGRQNLADQIAMVDIVKNELDNAENAISELKIIRNNRRRMVQITNYEKQRFNSHKNIFRTIAFCGLGVLISVYIVNAGWSTVGKTGIAASIAIGVILTMMSIYDNWWRSSKNWNQFNFGSYSSGPTVYQHDKSAIGKLYTEVGTGAHHLYDDAHQAGKKVVAATDNVVNSAVNAIPQ